MSTTATAQQQQVAEQPKQKGEVAVFQKPRLPYHPAMQERFGVDQAGWRALTDAIFPAAKTVDAIALALSYCKARKLDPFKRVVHIVPVWDSQQKRLVETVWPGIAELRTTAFRTGDYAGRDHPEYGEIIDDQVGNAKLRYPEWCRVTVYRMVKGQRVAFPGPRVYWIETYASAKRDDATPNSMWLRRPRGQLEKCAEAAALRAAFPEEIGGDYAADEMEGQAYAGSEGAKDVTPRKPASAAEQLAQFAGGAPTPQQAEHEDPAGEAELAPEEAAHDPETGEVIEPEEGAAAEEEAGEPAESEDKPTPQFRLFDESGKTGYRMADAGAFVAGLLEAVEATMAENRSPKKLWDANGAGRAEVYAAGDPGLVARLEALQKMVLTWKPAKAQQSGKLV